MNQIPNVQPDLLEQFDQKTINPGSQKVGEKKRKDQFKKLIAGAVGVRWSLTTRGSHFLCILYWLRQCLCVWWTSRFHGFLFRMHVKDCFLPRWFGTSFTPGALPDATLPFYPGLGPSLRMHWLVRVTGWISEECTVLENNLFPASSLCVGSCFCKYLGFFFF